MNRIAFSERRPESRKEDYTILVWSEDRPPFLTTVYSDGLVRYDAVKLTHWCEIEPPMIEPNPFMEQYKAKWVMPEPPQITPSKSLGACANGPEEPPKPDPFGESKHGPFYGHPFEEWLKPFLEANPNIGKINLADAAWDAAIKWKEGQK